MSHSCLNTEDLYKANSHEKSDVVAVCDPVETSRAAAAEQFGAALFADAEKMIASVDVDAVLVAAPAHLNAVTALPVIHSGLPVLLEKPSGLSVADVKMLQDAAEQSGAIVMVGFDRRFNPYVRSALEAVARHGEVRQVVAEFHKDIRDWTEDARFSPAMLNQLMLESPIHSIDLVTHLANSPVKSVSSVVRSANSPHRDVHAALIEFESGCVAQFTASLTAGGRLERYELHGDGVSAYLDGVNSGAVVMNKQVSAIPDLGEGATSTFLQDDYFVRTVAADGDFGEPAASLGSALVTLDLAERIYAGAG